MRIPASVSGAAATVNRLEEALMAFFLAVMTLLTALQVLLRYVFNTGLIWSLEATTYCFAWLVLVGMSYGVRTRSHIAVDLLVNRLSTEKRRTVGLVAIAISLAYALLMFYGGFEFVLRLYALGNLARDIPVARWLLTSTLPIGFALLAFRFVELGLKISRAEIGGLGMNLSETSGVLPGESPDTPGSSTGIGV